MGKILTDNPIIPQEGILVHDEGVTLLPANLELSGMDVTLVNAMSRETILRQGQRTDLTSAQVGPKLSVEIVADEAGESRNQIKRYIRLTELIPELLELVDQRNIAFNPAVELSYLSEQEQFWLLTTIESEEATPSLSQAQRMKKFSQDGKLTEDMVLAINVQSQLRLALEKKETTKSPVTAQNSNRAFSHRYSICL